jgi:tetratricopeptide (TPR) repeat protein
MLCSPTAEENETLHNNRAHANLQVGAFDAALNDASLVSDRQTRSENRLYRKALILYSLGKYAEAIEVLDILIARYPAHPKGMCRSQLVKSRLRLAEQERGEYDFKELLKATELRPPLLDCATYKGSVEIRKSSIQGRGLFTTKVFKAGDLLLCEKAFSYCFACSEDEPVTPSRSFANASYLVNIPKNTITLGTHGYLINDVYNKLMLNPSFASSIEDLCHGDYEGVESTSVDNRPVVDG